VLHAAGRRGRPLERTAAANAFSFCLNLLRAKRQSVTTVTLGLRDQRYRTLWVPVNFRPVVTGMSQLPFGFARIHDPSSDQARNYGIIGRIVGPKFAGDLLAICVLSCSLACWQYFQEFVEAFACIHESDLGVAG
jgi:hypothetical protein